MAARKNTKTVNAEETEIVSLRRSVETLNASNGALSHRVEEQAKKITQSEKEYEDLKQCFGVVNESNQDKAEELRRVYHEIHGLKRNFDEAMLALQNVACGTSFSSFEKAREFASENVIRLTTLTTRLFNRFSSVEENTKERF